MKIVSFKIAKALKEAGYPQDIHDEEFYYAENGLLWIYESMTHETLDDAIYCVCPYVMEVWLWLWRTKKVYFGVETEEYPHAGICLNDYEDIPYSDPEEAIEKAIEYLVENDLIK